MAATDELRRSLEPAEPQAIAALIEGLSILYPQQGRTDSDDRVRARAWLEDLAEYPADAIQAGCVAWRRSDTAWMPTPGQLIAKIEPIVTHRRRLYQRGVDLQDEASRGRLSTLAASVRERTGKAI